MPSLTPPTWRRKPGVTNPSHAINSCGCRLGRRGGKQPDLSVKQMAAFFTEPVAWRVDFKNPLRRIPLLQVVSASQAGRRYLELGEASRARYLRPARDADTTWSKGIRRSGFLKSTRQATGSAKKTAIWSAASGGPTGRAGIMTVSRTISPRKKMSGSCGAASVRCNPAAGPSPC